MSTLLSHVYNLLINNNLTMHELFSESRGLAQESSWYKIQEIHVNLKKDGYAYEYYHIKTRGLLLWCQARRRNDRTRALRKRRQAREFTGQADS
ncbi:hypothetical protein SDC9_97736 [bioreactor metagenome]|uniref:Uncharacterized protein n=1 Tax=bioreactor metagenome TaxID=1076179 RepID=A0A645ACV6_9ZZZZ